MSVTAYFLFVLSFSIAYEIIAPITGRYRTSITFTNCTSVLDNDCEKLAKFDRLISPTKNNVRAIRFTIERITTAESSFFIE